MSQISEQAEARRPPSSYGDVNGEYLAVREQGAGLIDLSARARINVSGSEAVQFLNGLITNDVKTLDVGAWMLAAFPTVQGRLLAFVRVLHRADGFLFEAEAAAGEAVLKTLSRFTLAGDFRVTELTNELASLSVQGARSAKVIAQVLGEEAARVERGRIIDVVWNGLTVNVIRATHTAEDGFDVFLSAEGAQGLWDALVEEGARPVGFEALEILRVEAGLPRYGVDVNETNVVLEAGLDDAVSFTKGCYIGQEIIARIHWRGHVTKKLAGLRLDEAAAIKSDDKVRSVDDKEIGRITSSCFSPHLKSQLAIALLKYDYLAPGTEVKIINASGEELRARVAELPFVRGSWYEESNAPAPEQGA